MLRTRCSVMKLNQSSIIIPRHAFFDFMSCLATYPHPLTNNTSAFLSVNSRPIDFIHLMLGLASPAFGSTSSKRTFVATTTKLSANPMVFVPYEICKTSLYIIFHSFGTQAETLYSLRRSSVSIPTLLIQQVFQDVQPPK